MKKVILLFLLILPVIIVSFAFLMASVIRTAIYPVIESVYVADKDWDKFMQEGYQEYGTGSYILYANVSDEFDLGKFFTVKSSSPNFRFANLSFSSSNPEAVEIKPNGSKIIVHQNMRSSDKVKGDIEIKAYFGEESKPWVTVYVVIEVDATRFDYFGIDYAALRSRVAALNFDYIEVSAINQLVITKEKAPATIALGEIIRDGLDIAPYDLLYNVNPNRTNFVNSLTFESGDTAKLSITSGTADGLNVFNATALDIGEVIVTIKTTWPETPAEIKMTIVIV